MNIEKVNDGVTGQGTMVIRAWNEPGHEHGFRARLTFSTDADPEPSMVVTTDEEEAIAAVRAWLNGLLSAAGSDTAGLTAEATNGKP